MLLDCDGGSHSGYSQLGSFASNASSPVTTICEFVPVAPRTRGPMCGESLVGQSPGLFEHL